MFAVADTHLAASEDGNRRFYLEQFYAGLNSPSVGEGGNSRKGGVIFWLLHLRGTLLLEFLFSWMIFFKIMGFFSFSL